MGTTVYEFDVLMNQAPAASNKGQMELQFPLSSQNQALRWQLFIYSCCTAQFWFLKLQRSLLEVNQHCAWTNIAGSGYLLKPWHHNCLYVNFVTYQSSIHNYPWSTSEMAKVT